MLLSNNYYFNMHLCIETRQRMSHTLYMQINNEFENMNWPKQVSTRLKSLRTPCLLLLVNKFANIYLLMFSFYVWKTIFPFCVQESTLFLEFKLHDTQYCSKEDIDKYLLNFFLDLIFLFHVYIEYLFSSLQNEFPLLCKL